MGSPDALAAQPALHQEKPRHQEKPKLTARQVALCAVGALAVTLGVQVVHPWHPSANAVREASLYLYIFSAVMLCLAAFRRQANLREASLRAQSITDPLTGLCNRRYFTSRLQTEMMRANRSKSPLALLLIDIDHLKVVNDTQGHYAGDTIIQRVAACIHQVCRSTDVLARLGGDEFAVLAPATQAAQAVELANRLRASLHACSSASLPLSVSIGVSDLARVGVHSAETLLGAADGAMYRAKQAGRDAVMVSEVGDRSTWAPLPARPQDADGINARAQVHSSRF